MVAIMIASGTQCCLSASPKTLDKQSSAAIHVNRPNSLLLRFPNIITTRLTPLPRRRLLHFASSLLEKTILISQKKQFFLTGLIETEAIPYPGLNTEELSLDEKAEILFVDQGVTPMVVLAVLYVIANAFRYFPEDLSCNDLKEPLHQKKGWLVWAVIRLVGALIAIALTGAAMSLFHVEESQREYCLLGAQHGCSGSTS